MLVLELWSGACWCGGRGSGWSRTGECVVRCVSVLCCAWLREGVIVCSARVVRVCCVPCGADRGRTGGGAGARGAWCCELLVVCWRCREGVLEVPACCWSWSGATCCACVWRWCAGAWLRVGVGRAVRVLLLCACCWRWLGCVRGWSGARIGTARAGEVLRVPLLIVCACRAAGELLEVAVCACRAEGVLL